MGFEYVYAYLENLYWFILVGLGLNIIWIGILVGLRIANEMDVDDWQYLMLYSVPSAFILLFLSFSPGMEHIREVRTKVREPIVAEKPIEVSAPLSPSISILTFDKNLFSIDFITPASPENKEK